MEKLTRRGVKVIDFGQALMDLQRKTGKDKLQVKLTAIKEEIND
jgi:hypothetical protein